MYSVNQAIEIHSSQQEYINNAWLKKLASGISGLLLETLLVVACKKILKRVNENKLQFAFRKQPRNAFRVLRNKKIVWVLPEQNCSPILRQFSIVFSVIQFLEATRGCYFKKEAWNQIKTVKAYLNEWLILFKSKSYI